MLRKFLVAGFALVLLAILAAIWWRIDGERMPEFHHPESRQVPEPNAFDLLVEAAEAIPDVTAVSAATAGEPTLDQRSRVVEDNREALTLLREALRHPFHYTDFQKALMGEEELRLSGFRTLARLLSVEASVHRGEERFGAAMASALDCIELGRRIGTDGTFITALTGVAIAGIGLSHTPEIVPELKEAELLDAIQRLEAYRDRPLGMTGILREERIVGFHFLDSIFGESNWRRVLAESDQRYLDESWMDSGGFSLPQRLRIHLRSWSYHKERIVAAFEALNADYEQVLEKPYPLGATRIPVPPRSLPKDFGETYFNAVPRVWFMVELNRTAHGMLLTIAALEAWKNRHGEYPAGLAQLEGDLLEILPRDPFAADAPLIYHRDGDGYVLYSIGPNGEDNDGQTMMRPDGPPERRYLPRDDLTGDLVAGVNVLRSGGHR